MGFKRFVLIDGDKVEITNLNRQAFDCEDLNSYKAEALEKKIKKINKYSDVVVISKFIKAGDVENVIKMGDIIINCADLDAVTYRICEESMSQEKLSISPLNIGFGTIILAFTKESESLLSITGGLPENDIDYLKKLYKGMADYKLPTYVKKNLLKAFLFINKNKFFPQNVIATQLSTSIILHTIIRYMDGKKIKLAPSPIAIDVEDIYG
jgi:hypothetical protein